MRLKTSIMPVCDYGGITPAPSKEPSAAVTCDGTDRPTINFNKPYVFVPLCNLDGNRQSEVGLAGDREQRETPITNCGYVGPEGYVTNDRSTGPNETVMDEAFSRNAVPIDTDGSIEAVETAEVRGAARSRNGEASDESGGGSAVTERPPRASGDRPEANTLLRAKHESSTGSCVHPATQPTVSNHTTTAFPLGVFATVIARCNTAEPHTDHCYHKNSVGSDNLTTTDSSLNRTNVIRLAPRVINGIKLEPNSNITNAQGDSNNAGSPAAGSSNVNQNAPPNSKRDNSIPFRNIFHPPATITRYSSGARATIPLIDSHTSATVTTNDSHPSTTVITNGSRPTATVTTNDSHPNTTVITNGSRATATVTTNDSHLSTTVITNGSRPTATVTTNGSHPTSTVTRNYNAPSATTTQDSSNQSGITKNDSAPGTSASATENNSGTIASRKIKRKRKHRKIITGDFDPLAMLFYNGQSGTSAENERSIDDDCMVLSCSNGQSGTSDESEVFETLNLTLNSSGGIESCVGNYSSVKIDDPIATTLPCGGLFLQINLPPRVNKNNGTPTNSRSDRPVSSTNSRSATVTSANTTNIWNHLGLVSPTNIWNHLGLVPPTNIWNNLSLVPPSATHNQSTNERDTGEDGDDDCVIIKSERNVHWKKGRLIRGITRCVNGHFDCGSNYMPHSSHAIAESHNTFEGEAHTHSHRSKKQNNISVEDNVAKRIKLEPDNVAKHIKLEPDNVAKRIKLEPDNVAKHIKLEPDNVAKRIKLEPDNVAKRIKLEPDNVAKPIKLEPDNVAKPIKLEPTANVHYESMQDEISEIRHRHTDFIDLTGE